MTGTWYHVAIVYSDAANFQGIYIDGVLRASNNLSGTMTVNNDPLQIGADQGFSGREFDGLIDEVRIYREALSSSEINTVMNETRVCPNSGPDHYTISHSGSGVTCEAESVTITAHDASHNPVAPPASTTITLSTSVANGGWTLQSGNGSFDGVDQYTFDGSETSVQFWLRQTMPITGMDIDVDDGSASDPDDGGSEDPPLDFSETGLRFYADGVNNAIGTQIAGKWSDDTTGIQTLTLRAVRTNSDTMACEARISGTQTVQMAFECIDPTTCKIPNGVRIIDDDVNLVGETLADNPQGGPMVYSNVDLDFDTNGSADWIMNYRDAGQIRLNASLTIAASGEDPADTLIGSSNSFSVVPAGLCVSVSDASAACATPDASCSAFRKARQQGNPAAKTVQDSFTLAVRAVGWQSAGENNTDFCSGNATTPNFQLNGIGIGHSLVAPAGGASGSIDFTSFDMAALDNGDHDLVEQTVSEVGVFTFTATPPDYFGETIAASTSAAVGRFYPDHFVLSDMQLTNRSDLACISTFTYMDENFQVSYDLEARNVGGERTRNYTTVSGFAKLTLASELNYGAADLSIPEDLSARLNVGAPIVSFTEGLADNMSDTLYLARSAGGPDGPYALSVGIAPVDDNDTVSSADDIELNSYNLDVDNAGGSDHGLIQSTVINYGRLELTNAYGSELVPMTVPLRVRYYDSTTSSFLGNPLDNCTSFDAPANVNLAAASYIAPLTAADLGLSGAGTVAAGLASFSIHDNGSSSAGPGVTGEVEYSMLVPGYLQYDWDGDNLYNNNPTARATFGIFNGNSKQIYYRQLYR
jgi:MSHA biogenesis protein MshQ